MRDIKIPSIDTVRLSLVSMSMEFLRLMIERDYEAAGKMGGFSISDDYSLPIFRTERRLGMIEKVSDQHPWMYRSIVRKEDKRMIGHISFHHKAPDPDLLKYSDLAAELAYTIEPDYRRKGYARESAIAMMEWANQTHGVCDFFLSISPTNLPSLRLADSMNFRKIGERQDPLDGLEYFLRAEIEEVLKAKKE